MTALDVQPFIDERPDRYYLPGYSCSECGERTTTYARYSDFNTALQISRRLVVNHLSEHDVLDNDEGRDTIALMTNTDTVTVELDVIIKTDEGIADRAQIMALSESDVFCRVVALSGPTGWPTVRFTGPRDQILHLLETYEYEDDLVLYLMQEEARS